LWRERKARLASVRAGIFLRVPPYSEGGEKVLREKTDTLSAKCRRLLVALKTTTTSMYAIGYDSFRVPMRSVHVQAWRMKTSHSPTVSDCFFAPLSKALSAARHLRACQRFNDEAFLKSGIVRVLEQVQSGRDWVQQLVVRTGVVLSVGNFFEALKSPRRLRLSPTFAIRRQFRLFSGVVRRGC